jgi:signal transduction histidine kinase
MFFLASVSLVLYLQQERAHERTQALLRELDATHVQLKEAHASLSTYALRVVTEGLTNIARHARAHHVWVRAIPGEQRLEIEVSDDGVGFDPTAVIPSVGHYGLIGLHERARLIGGQLAIRSSPGKGTTLLVGVPERDGGSGV